ncbi:pogo transposable element with ZNF domain isoform X2 [Ictalurus furcatus]|uniref:pogo transposable element with ZNF domain isoform X2 n=1 Tax=Ictalurus furcatus TaxID=66913 RepID=UPI0023504693|nr:pogo transposable element with ZNF domain isoform X2 [Ictalurus furcatus]
MEEADLFMECEEEELEPWQQMNQDEAHDSPGTAERTVTPSVSKPVVVSSISPASTNVTTVPLLTNPLPTALPACISKATPGQQLFLTQSSGGLTPVALSQVILPVTSPGAGAGSSQPIYLTTQGIQGIQGIPVQNIQSGQSPLSIVLNVQQGQTVRPITLVQAPGTPGLFKPAVGTTQIITPQAQMRPTTPVVNRGQAPGSFTAMQIPATLTIRNTAPASQLRVTSVPSSQPSPQPKPLPINTQTKIVTVKPRGSNLDMQNLMNIVNSVNIPTGSQPQTFAVMSNLKANGSGFEDVRTAPPVAQSNIVQATSMSPFSYPCPRCGARYKMVEALRGHTCFCCPDMTHTSVKSEVPAHFEEKQSAPIVKIKTESIMSPGEHQSRIVMLVDDFYYGTYEGNREYVPTDNLKEALSFRCFTCGKKQKNNIRLMNHMKFHVDVEQQSGEHTSCPHCFRQFPTPFRLQCHVESVHCTLESTTRCKICEWAFESEPVFLQHMKNTHKPGEMPYVCQLCQYRSSFYSDVHSHFCTWHEDTRYLLCIYCLKVFKNSGTYQQHFARHKRSSVYHCNKCRLQFLFTKEKVDHKVNHHKTFRKPAPLEGVQAGTKVTIRAYAGHKKTTGLTGPKTSKDSERNISSAQLGQTITEQKLLVPQSSGPPKKQITKMYGFLTKFQEYRALLGRQRCVECTFDIPDFANHYPTYVHCSLCTYSTCCSRAYANHMINNHVSSRTQKARSKRGSLSWLKLTCVWCNYKTTQGDLMAKHLAQFPDHSRCVFTLKRNPKIGFVEPKREHTPPIQDTTTHRHFPHGLAMGDSSGMNEDIDQELAPLGSSDSDLETDDSSQQEPPEMSGDEYKGKESAAKPNSPKPIRVTKDMLSVRQLRILLFALCSGIQKAAKDMDTEPQLIRTWLQDKQKRLDCEDLGSSSGEAVELLVEWVLVQREQQHPIREENLFQKASEIHSQTNESSSFRISYEWAVSFMLQHKLGLHNIGMPGHQLPHRMEENCQDFTVFVHRQIKTHNVPLSAVGAMDELSVFVDFDRLVDSTGTSKDSAFRLEGTGKPWMNIYLSVLADGTMLPTMLFIKGTPLENFSKGLSDLVQLEARVEGFSEKEELEIWTANVWQQYLNSQNGKKAMLVIDGHHSHMTEDFLATLSGTQTLPMVIPSGCSSQRQPLEMCVRPVLKKFLLCRWSHLATQNRTTGVKPEDLVRLLVSWLEEALACCSGRSQMIQHSFCFSRLITEHEEECKKENDAHLKLLNTLTEAMLGPEAIDSESQSKEETMEKQVTGVLERKENVSSENKISVEQAEREILDKTEEDGRTEIERIDTEQQALATMNEGLEVSSETSERCSPLLPDNSSESQAVLHVIEKEELPEPYQDLDTTEVDAGSNC